MMRSDSGMNSSLDSSNFDRKGGREVSEGRLLPAQAPTYSWGLLVLAAATVTCASGNPSPAAEPAPASRLAAGPSSPPESPPASSKSAPRTKTAEGDKPSWTSRGISRVKETDRAAPAVKDRWLSVTLLTRDEQGEWRGVADGKALYSGENMALRVELKQPAFIYVMNRTDDGPLVPLYPKDDTENVRLPGNTRIQLPPPAADGTAEVYQLDENPGIERLFVAATDTKVTLSPESLRGLADPKDVLRQPPPPATAPSPKPTPPPAMAPSPKPTKKRRRASAGVKVDPRVGVASSLLTRGVVRKRDKSPTVDAAPDAQGVAQVVLRIEHLP